MGHVGAFREALTTSATGTSLAALGALGGLPRINDPNITNLWEVAAGIVWHYNTMNRNGMSQGEGTGPTAGVNSSE